MTPLPREIRPPKIILFGDSIIHYSVDSKQGLAPQLQRRYADRLDVVLRGFSGYQTDWALKLSPGLFSGLGNGPVAAVIIFFGSNDATLPPSSQHVPIERYAQNLRDIVKIAYGHDKDTKVILIGPAVVDNTNPAIPPGRTNEKFAEYSKAAEDVAQASGAYFVELRSAFQHRLDEGAMPNDLLSDGLHFTDAGYKVLLDQVVNTLDEFLPPPESIPWMTPYWNYITEK